MYQFRYLWALCLLYYHRYHDYRMFTLFLLSLSSAHFWVLGILLILSALIPRLSTFKLFELVSVIALSLGGVIFTDSTALLSSSLCSIDLLARNFRLTGDALLDPIDNFTELPLDTDL
ncbi:hypothetical protein L798_14249 [Zootermopsis nevadensis]|uniref:Uncharacterized protein n=1 Tax=Zootermopsis nevadensis TaxID=136037 RepID=A0A067QZL5_ZOONE|nr:hypothetical protein L798_14249 [Zootermopsis nevadensis]